MLTKFEIYVFILIRFKSNMQLLYITYDNRKLLQWYEAL
jgi:hypothetical protein